MKKELLSAAGLIASFVLFASVVSAQGAAPEIRIVKPVPNGVVPVGQVPIEVSTSNLPAGGNNAWQVYLDDKLIKTVSTQAISTTVPVVQSGPHFIRVALQADGATVPGPQIAVTAAPATPTGTWFDLAWSAPAFAVMTIAIALLILISLRLTRRPADPETP